MEASRNELSENLRHLKDFQLTISLTLRIAMGALPSGGAPIFVASGVLRDSAEARGHRSTPGARPGRGLQ